MLRTSLLLLTLAGPIALAGPATAAPEHRTTWESGPYTWVKLQRQEAGAEPNQHPCPLTAGAVTALLAEVQLLDQGRTEPLFAAKELAGLQDSLVAALGQAGPGEDLVLFSTQRVEPGFLAHQLTTTARIFCQGGRLNLIVGDARVDYVSRIPLYSAAPPPEQGSRKRTGSVRLASAAGQSLRADWLALPLPASGAAIPVPTPATLPATGAAPAPAATPAAGPAPNAAERLRTLRQLRDQDLISEQEYQQKRQEILNGL
jgi:hypothetical protein